MSCKNPNFLFDFLLEEIEIFSKKKSRPVKKSSGRFGIEKLVLFYTRMCVNRVFQGVFLVILISNFFSSKTRVFTPSFPQYKGANFAQKTLGAEFSFFAYNFYYY